MNSYITRGGLQVASVLDDLIKDRVAPDSVAPAYLMASAVENGFLDARLKAPVDLAKIDFEALNKSWNPEWRYQFQILGNKERLWTMEIQIPFKSLGAKAPKTEDVWQVNFGRRRWAYDKLPRGKPYLYRWQESEDDKTAHGKLCFK